MTLESLDFLFFLFVKTYFYPTHLIDQLSLSILLIGSIVPINIDLNYGLFFNVVLNNYFNITFSYINCLFCAYNIIILSLIGYICYTAFLFFYCDSFALYLFLLTHWHFLQSHFLSPLYGHFFNIFCIYVA